MLPWSTVTAEVALSHTCVCTNAFLFLSDGRASAMRNRPRGQNVSAMLDSELVP